ncbi:MAG: NifB/NifX family molybdenum-iron cluster-binding protein [Christensenellales bacterium]|jgi:predicted Fe-Mo cluster-binding NifX family protein
MDKLRIAVPYKDDQVFQSFGRASHFMVYDVEKGKVVVRTLVNTDGSGKGAMADILKKIHITTILCGNLGDGAKRAVKEAGIALYAGVTGEADKAVDDFLNGRLLYDNQISCSDRETHHVYDEKIGEEQK